MLGGNKPMKRTIFTQVLGIGLLFFSFLYAAERSLPSLVAKFLIGVVKLERIYKNEFGDSYKIKAVKKRSDLETYVSVGFSSGGKTYNEEIIFRVLEAELFLTEEKAGLGISGAARIEWAYGSPNNPQGFPGIGEWQEQYFVLSKKDNLWVSPAENWVADTFRQLKSSWTKNRKGKHEIMKWPSVPG